MVLKQNYWTLLREGHFDDAIGELQQMYAQKPDASHIMTLGVAYLWAARYADAFNHFQGAIQTYRATMASFFGMAGATKWCLDEPDEAVAQWRKGLRAQYADGAGGVKLPMLLFYAAITRSAFPRLEAVGLLAKKAKGPRARNWPGPLGAWILDDNAGDDTILDHCKGINETDTLGRRWLTGFYKGVRELSSGTPLAFKNYIQETVDFVLNKSLDENIFVGCLWHVEFFLARHELSRDKEI